ncbi:asparagine synthase (glutamine-hydrolyzing) [Halobellus inordinatus]|uniref:asparagine synthase (glutamine-hydrolyzing) n=1 Tax=Halobellus inordinatus TaxID=1126236 RepID=UPI002108C631|nr:asparagine synthase (glutamine-hydrolyzing) [Halobellus inordinatus]
MCGICGAIGLEDQEVLDDMSACQRHRGPNSTGTHFDDGVMLANQRLSIIDVDGGDQPIYNEEGDIVVVYNGEIYNFQALRRELENRGHEFTTQSDTEVLVHGYEEYGKSIFERLNGMFAVALYDASRSRLLLARDRAGIKPLYVAPQDEEFLFASEPKSILRSGRVSPAVDADALGYFLQLRYSPPHTSLFDGIETVQPGTVVDVRLQEEGYTATTEEYWDLSMTPTDPPVDPVKAVRNALGRAVRRQLVSEVPVGFYLSGGLDTSSVVAMADEHTDEPVHTFCMGFSDSRWDERDDARAVADHFGTNHHEIVIEQEYMQDFPAMIWHADEPKRNLYPYYVAQEMSDHVTVALGGLGADELFGGYVYRYSRLGQLEALRSPALADTRQGLAEISETLFDMQVGGDQFKQDSQLEDIELMRSLDDPAQLYVLLNSTDVIASQELYEERAFGERLQDRVPPSEVIEDRHTSDSDLDLRESALQWDFTVKLPDDFLLVEDRTSMAHSLESRVPFLDNDLIDLAFSLPLSEKFGETGSNVNAGKAVLRKAMRDVLPAVVFEKDKQGFTMPTYPFVRDEMLPHARNILNDPHVVREGFVQQSYLDRLLNGSPRKDLTPHYKLLWKIVGLEIWYQMYIVGDAAGPQSLEEYYT